MYRLILFLVAAFAVSVVACQQTQQLPETTAGANDKLENALLWKIGGDKQPASYLFGTIHIIEEDEYFLPDGTLEAIDQSEVMVFEIDMDDMMDLGAQIGMFTKAFMPNGTKLSDLLSEEDYTIVKDYFNDMGLPMFMLDRIKPMFLSVFASMDMDMSEGSFSMDSWKSYEMEFHELALDKGMEIAGLETMEYQMAVFDSIPYEDQAEMLVDMIKYRDEGNEQFEQLIAAYKSQDVDQLATLIAAEEGGMAEHEDILLKNRNENWIPAMERLMEEGPVFFAVGAGHLGGQYGVIRLLRKAGYDVTPVLSAPQDKRGQKF